MSNTLETAADVRPKSLLARFIGIVTSPKETFQAVVAHPRWFGMLAVSIVLLAVLVGGFLFTQVGQDAWLDAALSSPWAAGREMSDQQYEGMERMAQYAGYFGVAQMVVFVPIMTVIMAGILYAVFNAALGGDASFKQLYTVVVHAGVISVVGQLFTMPLNYLRGTMTSATNLRVLLPMIEETSFLGRLFGMIDLFLIWWVVVLAIGLGVLYKRRTQPIAMTLFGLYAVIILVAALIMSRLGGGN